VSSCALAARSAEENLVKNPGFEEAISAKGQNRGGWWLYLAKGEPELKADNTISHSGKASARVHAESEAKCTVVSAPFPVAPADELRFGAWVRAEGLPAKQRPGYVGIAFRSADGRVIDRAYVSTEIPGGTWSFISGTAKTPTSATSAEIHLGYTNAP